MAANKIADKFYKLIEKVFSTPAEQNANQLDYDRKYPHLFKEDYEAIIKIIIGVKDATVLTDLMSRYLQSYTKNSSNKNNIHYYRSDQVFQLLFEQSAKVNKDKGDLFETWDNFLSGKESSDFANSLRKRYSELSNTVRSLIDAFRKDQQEKNRQNLSILDVLKKEYTKQKGYPPKSNDDLYAFDPGADPNLIPTVERFIKNIVTQWNDKQALYTESLINRFDLSLAVYKKALEQVQGNALLLFQVIQYFQDRLKTVITVKRVGDTTETHRLQPESYHDRILYFSLYTMACVQLMVVAQKYKLFTRNRWGFTKEEVAYFIQPVKAEKFAYTSNLEKVLSSTLKNPDELFGQIESLLKAYLLTQGQLKDTTLVNLEDTLRIQGVWRDVNALTEKLKKALADKNEAAIRAIASDPANVPAIRHLQDISQTAVDFTQAGPELSKAKLFAGNHVGENKYGDVAIVYIDPGNPENVYIEFASLKPLLFTVRPAYLKRVYYSSQILEIYKSTIGVVYITQFIFQAMGFMPVLIEVGFAGLIYEIAVFYASEKIEEQVAKINPTLGKVVGLLFNALAPRPSFTPGIKGTAEEPVIRSEAGEVHLWESPKEDLASIVSKNEKAAMANNEARGTLGKLKESAADTLAKAPAVSRENMGKLLDRAADKVTEKLGMPAGPELATTGPSVLLRESGAGVATKGTGGLAKGTGSGKLTSRAEVKLTKLEHYKVLDNYKELLTKSDLKVLNGKIDEIMEGLQRGTLGYTEATKKVTVLLNSVKEKTGEFVAEGTIASNFKLLKEVYIPSRGENGVPMLDKVYKVQDLQTKEIKFILMEIKGGESTRLGQVNAYKISFKNGKVSWVRDGDRMIKQASGEWYYQRIYEIYDKGHQELARELFNALKKGNVETVIVKSGIAMDPKVTFNTGEIIKFFRNKTFLQN